MVAEQAGDFGRSYRRSHHLDSADLIIAATARLLGTTVATTNLRHFPMFEGLAAPYPA